MAGEHNIEISKSAKGIFCTMAQAGQIDSFDLIENVRLDGWKVLADIDGREAEIKVKAKTAYMFNVDGDPKVGTGWPLISANQARESGDDFFMVFMDYKTGIISGDWFLRLIEPRDFDLVQWPYHYNAGGQQLELYSTHLMDTLGHLAEHDKEHLKRLSIMNRKADKNQKDLFI